LAFLVGFSKTKLQHKIPTKWLLFAFRSKNIFLIKEKLIFIGTLLNFLFVYKAYFDK